MWKLRDLGPNRGLRNSAQNTNSGLRRNTAKSTIFCATEFGIYGQFPLYIRFDKNIACLSPFLDTRVELRPIGFEVRRPHHLDLIDLYGIGIQIYIYIIQVNFSAQANFCSSQLWTFLRYANPNIRLSTRTFVPARSIAVLDHTFSDRIRRSPHRSETFYG